MLQELNKHIPVDVCFVQNSFQTIVKLKECVMLNGKQMKVSQSLFFITRLITIVLTLVHIHILKIMDFSVV